MGKTFLSHFKFWEKSSKVSVSYEKIDEHVYFFPPSISSEHSSVYFNQSKNLEIFLPPLFNPITTQNFRSDLHRIEFLTLINLANLVNCNLSKLNIFELQHNHLAIIELSKIFQLMIDDKIQFKKKRKNKNFLIF